MHRPLLPAILGALCVVALPGLALASPCGTQATIMLRRFGLINPEQTTPNLFSSSSSAASTEPTRPGGVTAVPVTASEQRKASELVKQAISADHAGDRATCDADLAQAKHILP